MPQFFLLLLLLEVTIQELGKVLILIALISSQGKIFINLYWINKQVESTQIFHNHFDSWCVSAVTVKIQNRKSDELFKYKNYFVSLSKFRLKNNSETYKIS